MKKYFGLQIIEALKHPTLNLKLSHRNKYIVWNNMYKTFDVFDKKYKIYSTQSETIAISKLLQ